MIPVKLTLSNFTSYGTNPPELDFTTFKLAAISGQNGAGKSSLLDSITWCLWGTSRAGDSADALVRLGQTEMMVEFSFELDSHLYTVKRRRSKKSGGLTALELWSNSHNLTEGTIKTTQQKIIDLLHLSYETFANSSYIRQGHAEAFTTKGPTDRKRILADILGLDHYDRLEEKAKEKSKEVDTKLQLMEYQLLEIEAELSQKEEREKELNLAQAEARIAENQLKDIEKSIKTIESQATLLEARVKMAEEKKKQVSNTQKELEDLNLQISLKNKAKEEYQTILDQKHLIETSFQKLQDLQLQKQALDEKRSQLIKVKDELVALQKIINERENKRTEAINKIAIQIKELQTKNDQLELQNKQLKTDKSVCPTCGQPIGEEKNNRILKDNEGQIKESLKKIAYLKETIEKYQSVVLPEVTQAKDRESEVSTLEKATATYFEITRQLSELDKYQNAYTKLQQAETAVKTHQEAITDLQKMLENKQIQITKSQKELGELTEYESQFQEIKNQLTAEESVKNELALKAAELRSRVGAQQQLVKRSDQLQNLFKQKTVEKSKLTFEKQVYEELALAFGKKGIQAMIIEQAIPEIEDEANRLLDRLTDGRMKVHLETQKETKTKVLGAEGRKEHATVETLDIIISDEMGERSYEMYSGGEAFRVNFAIRLAISKLLTLRAGAKLQFLVVDEGFGNQDAAGRARLIEVIDQIKDDYKKILVITHLDELKEEFPTRIEVSKNTLGSTFEVVGT